MFQCKHKLLASFFPDGDPKLKSRKRPPTAGSQFKVNKWTSYQDGEGRWGCWDRIKRFHSASFFCACPYLGRGFPTSYFMVFFVLFTVSQSERWLFVLFSVSQSERWLFVLFTVSQSERWLFVLFTVSQSERWLFVLFSVSQSERWLFVLFTVSQSERW
jgi:hypothetical protein